MIAYLVWFVVDGLVVLWVSIIVGCGPKDSGSISDDNGQHHVQHLSQSE
jgi:hypothetical protein